MSDVKDNVLRLFSQKNRYKHFDVIIFLIPLQRLNRKCPDGGIGRRAGLKHQWIHFHAGSIPALGTKKG